MFLSCPLSQTVPDIWEYIEHIMTTTTCYRWALNKISELWWCIARYLSHHVLHSITVTFNQICIIILCPILLFCLTQTFFVIDMNWLDMSIMTWFSKLITGCDLWGDGIQKRIILQMVIYFHNNYNVSSSMLTVTSITSLCPLMMNVELCVMNWGVMIYQNLSLHMVSIMLGYEQHLWCQLAILLGLSIHGLIIEIPNMF